MAKKLKTYQTSVGFFDLAVAAPSMKAALAAWGSGRNLFHDGVAKQTDDPKVVAATMAAPGVVLKRPVGSSAAFKAQAELPTGLAGGGSQKAVEKPAASKKKQPQRTRNPAPDRKAALAFEREQKRRERERAKEAAAQQKERERRQRAVDKARAALDAARRAHEKTAADIETAREALEEKSQAEGARWEKAKDRLEAALRRTQG
jgi:hypothetical protein